MSYGDHVNYNTGESCMCCQKCGVVYAPWVIKCDYHKKEWK